MNPRVKLGAFVGALVVIAGFAFGIAKVLSDGDNEPSTVAGQPAGGDDHGQQSAGVHDDAGGDGRYRVVFEASDFENRTPSQIKFKIRRGDQVINDFEVESGRKMHLIVVRHDLSGFQHLHPELADDGSWSTPVEFAAAGPQRAYADFKVAGERLTIPFDLTVAGDYDPRTLPDPSSTARVDGGYSVRLARRGDDGEQLDFRVSKDGRAVNDLADYLGSKGHLVAINSRTLEYSHVHPTGARDNRVSFDAELEDDDGNYRLFFQFLHGGEVHTAEFTVRPHDERVAGDDQGGLRNPRESDDQHGGSEHPEPGDDHATDDRR